MAKTNSLLCCIAIFLTLLGVSTCQIPPRTWCVASGAATDQQLQGFIDFACGGKIDCRWILPGQACYNPNTPRAHGSWSLNTYYREYKECNPIGTIVNKDPSYGDCLYI